MPGRAISFALLFCTTLSSTALAESIDWRTQGLRQNVVLCAALFNIRGDWMVQFKMNGAASGREFAASRELQRIYGKNVLELGGRAFRPMGDSDPPLIRGPLTRGPADLSDEVYSAKQKLLSFFTENGAMKYRPPVCLEDEICASCWDLLRLMQSQD